MSQKRQPDEAKEGSEAYRPEEKKQKIPSLHSVISRVVKMNELQKLASVMEPLIRKIVKEEIDEAFAKHLLRCKRNCAKQIYPSASKELHLKFRNNISLPIFTGTKIEGQGHSTLSVELIDILTGEIVPSDSKSTLKVEIVVLEGDFGSNDGGDWSVQEFESNIVKEREGKGSLLGGDTFLILNEGAGILGDIFFTDNSSWTRSRKFRLGAKLVDGCLGEIRVREARTESFIVKDHRGELYKKHFPPTLQDEVWRLQKIGKDGAFHKRLTRENILTVKDFLTLFHTNKRRLQQILGNGMSAKMWEVMVGHAKTCVLDPQRYVYYIDNGGVNGVIFNVVGKLNGLLQEEKYFPVSDLSDAQKEEAAMHVKNAYEHWDQVRPFELPAITNSSNLATQSENSSISFSSCHSDIFSLNQMNDISLDLICMDQDPYEMGPLDLFHELPGPDTHCNSSYMDQITASLMIDKELPSQSFSSKAGCENEKDFVDGFLSVPTRGWAILSYLLRWRFSIRRIVKRRTMQREKCR